jgi:hypothetical protein
MSLDEIRQAANIEPEGLTSRRRVQTEGGECGSAGVSGKTRRDVMEISTLRAGSAVKFGKRETDAMQNI